MRSSDTYRGARRNALRALGHACHFHSTRPKGLKIAPFREHKHSCFVDGVRIPGRPAEPRAKLLPTFHATARLKPAFSAPFTPAPPLGQRKPGRKVYRFTIDVNTPVRKLARWIRRAAQVDVNIAAELAARKAEGVAA